jgi:hypothetical protein
MKVGPVIDKSDLDTKKLQGQFIAAGYTGHGMTRAYAWYAFQNYVKVLSTHCLLNTSAEAVAGMVVADISGTPWTQPDWLPQHFLTTVRDSGKPE